MPSDRSLLAISIAVAVEFIGIGMVLPVRILYAQAHGASLALIGAMASAFLLSNFLCQYPAGWLADAWGRRPLMIVALAGQAALGLLYLAVTDPLEFVLLRCIEGACATGVLPAARAMVADLAPPDRQGAAYGVFSSFLNAGFLLGPALGGLLASAGYTSTFVGSCLFRLAALAIVALLVRGGGRVRSTRRAQARAVPRRALFTPALLGAYILAIGDNLYFGFDLTLMPLWMRQHLDAPVAAIGLAYSVWALPNVFGAPLGGRMADRARRSTLVLALGLAQVPMYAAYGLLTAVIPVLVVFGLHGAIFALMQPSVDATLAAAAPPDARARVQGLYSAVGLAAAFVAANSLSALYGVNFRLPLLVMAACFAICVLVGGALIRRAERAVRTAETDHP